MSASPLEAVPPPARSGAHRPWYTRRWAQRLRRVGEAAGVALVLALIPYPRYVTEECVVLPISRVEVRAQVEGIISEIAVDEASVVHAGQVLARLDDREVSAQLLQARAELARLAANALKMRRGSRLEEIARAESVLAERTHDLSFAELEAERAESLYGQGVGSAERRDATRGAVAVKRAALQQAEAELRLIRAGFRPEEVAMAQAELERPRAEERYLETRRSQHTVASPINGVVMTPRFRERLHLKVSPGDTICEVAEMKRVRVEVFVPERSMDIVAVGQPVVVKVISYPLHPFDGTVSFLAPAVEERNQERVVRVVTEIDNTEGLLREGMTGYAEINTGRSHVLFLALRRTVRWLRVRLLI